MVSVFRTILFLHQTLKNWFPLFSDAHPVLKARPLLDLSMHNFWLRFQQLLEKDHQNSLILKNLIQR
jgi:hypothetical protein